MGGWRGEDPWSRKLAKNRFAAKSLSYLRIVRCLTCFLDPNPYAFSSCRIIVHSVSKILYSRYIIHLHLVFVLRKVGGFPKHIKLSVIFCFEADLSCSFVQTGCRQKFIKEHVLKNSLKMWVFMTKSTMLYLQQLHLRKDNEISLKSSPCLSCCPFTWARIKH